MNPPMPGPDATPPSPQGAGKSIRHVRPEEVRANPYQPRSNFDPAALGDLAASVREHGILQPLVVRETGAGLELIAGERRLRAAQEAGLDRVPVVVRHTSDQDMQILALVENVQRVDLGAMEKARAMRSMMRNHGLTQEQVADKVGKARTTVANFVRLLDLPDVIQLMVEEGRLSGAHARAILQAEGTERRIALAQEAIRRGWSVREVEKAARKGPASGSARASSPRDPYVQDLEDRLTRTLSTKVQLQAKGSGGELRIRYANADELDRLIQVFEGGAGA